MTNTAGKKQVLFQYIFWMIFLLVIWLFPIVPYYLIFTLFDAPDIFINLFFGVFGSIYFYLFYTIFSDTTNRKPKSKIIVIGISVGLAITLIVWFLSLVSSTA